MTLQCEITLLAEGGTDAFGKRWVEKLPAEQQSGYDLSMWQRTAIDLLRRGRGRYEVFICLMGDPTIDGWDWNQLKVLLNDARHSTWGAPIYLVISRQIMIEKDASSLAEWMDAAVKGRAQDILQLEYDPVVGPTPEDAQLRNACDESRRNRQAFITSLSDHGTWGCVLSDRRLFLHRVLKPLSCLPGGEASSAHWVLVVEDEREQLEDTRQRLLEFPTGDHLVATLGAFPSPELEGLCSTEGLYGPVEFRAELEIWYFLLRLNARLSRRVGRIRYVGGSPLSVLFTNTFNPDCDEPDQIFQATQDIGDLLASVPIRTHYRVETKATPKRLVEQAGKISMPKATPERLIEQAGEKPLPFVWVHIGHGLGNKGLKGPDSSTVSPERWVKCFGDRLKDSVPLAMLLCCRSAETAEQLARAGVPVAIGFEGDVLSDRSRILAGSVLQTALEHRGARDRILEAFENASDKLEGTEPSGFQSSPIAVCYQP